MRSGTHGTDDDPGRDRDVYAREARARDCRPNPWVRPAQRDRWARARDEPG